MNFDLREVDANSQVVAWKIRRLNAAAGDAFPELETRHFRDGYWWFASTRGNVVGFAGMVEHLPKTGILIGFFKRVYVVPSARGHGLQRAFMREREAKARRLGWTHLLSETDAGNLASINNHLACGFDRFEPDQPWGPPDAVYWSKRL